MAPSPPANNWGLKTIKHKIQIRRVKQTTMYKITWIFTEV